MGELDEYKKAAENVKSPKQKARLYHQCGMLLLADGNIEEALKYLSLACKEDSKNPELLETIRECYTRLKSYPELVDHAEKEISIVELNQAVKIAVEVARFLEASDRKKDAFDFLIRNQDKLKSSNHFNFFLLKFERGFVSEKQWIEDAENIIASAEGASDPEITFELALLYLSQKEFKRAIFHLTQFLNSSPDNFSAMQFLIDCYIQTKDMESLLNLFESKSMPPEFKSPLLFYSARELLRAGENDKALQFIEEQLGIKPNLLSMELKRAIEKRSNPELFQKESDLLDDKFFLKYIAYSMTRENGEKLNPEDVFAIFQKLLQMDAEDVNTLRQLERYIEPEDQPDGLVKTLEVEAQLIKDKRLLVGVMLTLARVYLSMVDLDKALESLKRAIEIDPNNFNVLHLLEKVLTELKDWSGLVDILQKEIELIQDPKEVLYLYFRIGEIFERNLEELQQAAGYYEKVLALSPNYIPALRALRRVYAPLEKWQELLDVIKREITLTSDGNTLVELMLECASIYEIKLNDALSAQKTYYEVLESSPGNLIAISALKRLCKKTGDYEGLRNVLLKEVGFVHDSTARADIWFDLGDLCENKFGDHDEALNCFTRCLKEDNNYVPAYSAIELLLKKSNRLEELKQFYVNLLDKISDKEAQISIILKLTELSNSTEETLSLYERGLKISPYNPILLNIVESFLESKNNYQKLIDILDRKIEIANSELVKSALLFKKGIILEKHLNNPDAALRSFEDATERNPDFTQAWEHLIQLCELQGNFKKLSVILKNYSKSATSERKTIELLTRHAVLNVQYLNNISEAIESYESILKIDEKDLNAMQNLYELYLATARIEDAIRVLSGYINFIDGTEKKVKEIKKLVTLLEKEGDYTQALNWLKEAHRLLPDDISVFIKMEELLYKMRNWDELLKLYEEHLKLELTEQNKFELHKNAGKIAWECLKLPDRASQHMEWALEIIGDDKESLNILDKIYSEQGERKKLIDVLERLIKITEGEEKISLLRRAGRIYRESQDQINAIRIYEEMHKYSPDDREMLESLDSLYQATSQWDKQFAICNELLSKMKTKEGIAELHYKMGYAKLQLNATKEAMEHFNSALENIPSHIPSLREKCNILRTKENYPLLSKSLIELAKYVEDREEKSSVLTESAIILLEKLNLEDESIKVFEEAYEQNEGNYTAVLYLSELFFRKKNWQSLLAYSQKALNTIREKLKGKDLAGFLFRKGFAEEQLGKTDDAFETYKSATEILPDFIEPGLGLVRIYLLRSNYKDALEILKKLKPLVEKTGDKAQLFFVLLKLGVASYQLEDFKRSVEYLESAKRLKSMDAELLSELAGVYELMSNWERCALNLEEWLTLGIMDKRELYLLRLGKIYQDNLKKHDRAHECFSEAIKMKPEFIQGHIALIDFYTSMERWNDCAEQIKNLLDHLKDKNERTKWLLKLATILYEKLNQSERAIEIANILLNEGETPVEGYELLAKIYTHNERWEEALSVYAKIKEKAPSTEVKVNALLSRGRILKEKLNRPNVAIDDFKEVLRIEPNNINAHISLAEIYDMDAAKVAESIKEHHEIISLDPAYIPSYKSLGKIYESQREYDRAFCVYSVLKIFDALDEMERVFFNSVSSRAVKRLSVPITEEIKRRAILHPSENLALRQLWNTIQNELDTLYPGDIQKYGVTKEDLLPQKSPIDVVIAGNEVAEQLGVKSFRLYKSKNIKKVVVENTSPPSIIIPAKFIEEMKIDELRFVLGIYMEYIASNNLLPLKLGGEEIKKLLNLIKKSFNPDLRIPLMNEEEAQQQAKKIYKAFSRRTRNAVQEILDAHGKELLEINYNEYLKGIKMRAVRTAFVFVNNLNVALKVIPGIMNGGEAILSAPAGNAVELIKSSEFAKDLVIYSVSNRYFEARKSLKLSILS
jgi:tetratricopeptide (TPR) repeat protein